MEIYGMRTTVRSESDGSIRSQEVRFLAASPDEAARSAARHVRFLTRGSDTFPFTDDVSVLKASLMYCQVFCELIDDVDEDGSMGTITLLPFIDYCPKDAKYLPRAAYFRGRSAYQLEAPGNFEDFVEAFVANEVIGGSIEIPMSGLRNSFA